MPRCQSIGRRLGTSARVSRRDRYNPMIAEIVTRTGGFPLGGRWWGLSSLASRRMVHIPNHSHCLRNRRRKSNPRPDPALDLMRLCHALAHTFHVQAESFDLIRGNKQFANCLFLRVERPNGPRTPDWHSCVHYFRRKMTLPIASFSEARRPWKSIMSCSIHPDLAEILKRH